MSTFEALSQFEPCITAVCPLYEPGHVGTVFFLGDFYPLFLTLGFFSISLAIQDFYLLLFSMSLGVHIIANYALRVWIVAADNRFPGCGVEHQMPSLSTDHMIFFVTVLITFVFLWRHDTSSIRIFQLSLFMIFAIVCRVYIGINTVLELFLGSLHGLIWAILFQLFVYYIALPRLEYILSLKIAKRFRLKTFLIPRHMLAQKQQSSKDKKTRV